MTSPPYSPASNGQVERYVATMKQSLKKMAAEGGDLQENLSRFLLMVISATGQSPSALMLGRELRSRLDLLKEKPPYASAEHFKDKKLKFREGEIVMAKDFRNRKVKWTQGKISKILGNTVCIVEVQDMTWKRHFSQLRKCSLKSPTFKAANEEIEFEINLPSESDDEPTVSHHGQENAPVSENELLQNENQPQEENAASASANQEVRKSTRCNKGQPPDRYFGDK